MKKEKVIDLKVWQQWRDFEKSEDSPGFFLQLLQQALTSSPDYMQGLERAIAAKDPKGVFYNAHTLASSCLSLGAMDLGNLLRQIEAAAKQTPPLFRDDLLPSVQSAFSDFMNEIQIECAKLQSRAS